MEPLTIEQFTELKRQRGVLPRVLILANSESHMLEIQQTKLYKELEKQRGLIETIITWELIPLRGMRPVEVIIPTQFKTNPKADDMISYLPAFNRGNEKIPVLILKENYTFDRCTDNVNVMIDFFCDR